MTSDEKVNAHLVQSEITIKMFPQTLSPEHLTFPKHHCKTTVVIFMKSATFD